MGEKIPQDGGLLSPCCGRGKISPAFSQYSIAVQRRQWAAMILLQFGTILQLLRSHIAKFHFRNVR
ncbi:MAG: hypothetical protein ACOYJZ_05460, partial [Acutalibacter sp.]